MIAVILVGNIGVVLVVSFNENKSAMKAKYKRITNKKRGKSFCLRLSGASKNKKPAESQAPSNSVKSHEDSAEESQRGSQPRLIQPMVNRRPPLNSNEPRLLQEEESKAPVKPEMIDYSREYNQILREQEEVRLPRQEENLDEFIEDIEKQIDMLSSKKQDEEMSSGQQSRDIELVADLALLDVPDPDEPQNFD